MNDWIFYIYCGTLVATLVLLCAFFWWAVGSLVAEVIKRIWHTLRG